MSVIDFTAERQARRNSAEAWLICCSALDAIDRRRQTAIAAYRDNPASWLAKHGQSFGQFLAEQAEEEREWWGRMP
ncbi:MAG: hypothetical protein RO009_15720 [Pseudorhodoplanes sp.]|jgi:hypothetical protein|nr:hypothetical protein [Pseudorhodoplanes sp.]